MTLPREIRLFVCGRILFCNSGTAGRNVLKYNTFHLPEQNTVLFSACHFPLILVYRLQDKKEIKSPALRVIDTTCTS
jgi:hypothetical protein